MIDALYTAATGMMAQQTGMDIVANNLANVNTPAFKRSRNSQTDLGYWEFALANGQRSQVGLGAAQGQTVREMVGGQIQNTERALDIAINGEGFLRVRLPDGTLGYSRAGVLAVDAQGRLGLATGELLQPPITIPPGVSDLSIAQDGQVSAKVDGELRQIGRIELTLFANPAGLIARGGNIYIAAPNAGNPQNGNPGAGGRGTLEQGKIETSNVNVAVEMIEMITAQRAFEAASRVISASDEMLTTANGIRR